MSFATAIQDHKYAKVKPDGRLEDWFDISDRVIDNVAVPYLPRFAPLIRQSMYAKKFIPGGRYLYAAGQPFCQVQNCCLLEVEDSREGWAGLAERVTSALMTGAGVGVVYSKLRHRGAPIRGMGGHSTGPVALMQMINEIGRNVRQGGSRRSAIWAGLHWNHPDVMEFIHVKNWPESIKQAKANDFNAYAPMDMTNISVILDDAFFLAYNDINDAQHVNAHSVYWTVVRQMCETGEPGFSIDVGVNAGEHLRNA